MLTLYYACAGAGAAIVVLQFLMGFAGIGHDGDLAAGHGAHDAHVEDGLNLFSVRAMSAGLAFFGIGGAGATAAGLGTPGALAVAAALGAGSTLAVAAILRSFTRLEGDGTVRIEGAVGMAAEVYVSIPGGRTAPGKIVLSLQSRTVELQAVTVEDAIPTGTAVTVVDVLGPDTVEVVRTPDVFPEIPA